MKPFSLSFDYTPKWKNNRKRDDADRVVVRLRDFSQSKQIAISEKMREQLTAATATQQDAQTAAKAILDLRRSNLEVSFDLLRKHFVSVSNLAVESDNGETIEIRDADALIEHCEDLALEIAMRLVNGPDEEELKNS